MNSKKAFYEHKKTKDPDEIFKKLNNEMKSSKVTKKFMKIFFVLFKFDFIKVGLDINTVITKKLRELDMNSLKSTFEKCSIYDYRCMISCGELVLLLGCGVILIFNLFT